MDNQGSSEINYEKHARDFTDRMKKVVKGSICGSNLAAVLFQNFRWTCGGGRIRRVRGQMPGRSCDGLLADELPIRGWELAVLGGATGAENGRRARTRRRSPGV